MYINVYMKSSLNDVLIMSPYFATNANADLDVIAFVDFIRDELPLDALGTGCVVRENLHRVLLACESSFARGSSIIDHHNLASHK